MNRLPIGKQVFRQLIEGDFVYVDKTRYLVELADSEIPTFLSRPRRFGKSLTVNTFKEMFLGNRELFKGTYAYDNWDFSKKSSVIKLDMSSVDTTSIERAEQTLLIMLNDIASDYGVILKETSIPLAAFKELISSLSGDNGVAVLIDEYDSPLLKALYMPIMDDVKRILRDFYSQLKSNEEYIRFLFITGITKFSKVGIFSALNNLSDITLREKYSAICGYTKDEIVRYFDKNIENSREELKLTSEEFWSQLKFYYNGYSWDGKVFMFNPFSILNFFDIREFLPFWMESGSPSFMMKFFKDHKLTMDELDGLYVMPEFMSDHDIDNASPESFLTQAGYLTIKEKKRSGVILGFPNYEVKQTLNRHLLKNRYNVKDGDILRAVDTIIDALDIGDTVGFLEQINVILSTIPYQYFDNNKNEYFYTAQILMFLQAGGLHVEAEKTANRGRMDLVFNYKNHIYIIELKKDSAETALKQIKEKNYHGQYKNHNCTLIGLALDFEKRSVTGWKIENL